MQKEENNSKENSAAFLKQKIDEQAASLEYLQGKRERNLQILHDRIKEIKEKNERENNNGGIKRAWE